MVLTYFYTMLGDFDFLPFLDSLTCQNNTVTRFFVFGIGSFRSFRSSNILTTSRIYRTVMSEPMTSIPMDRLVR